jgi:HSP20 family protein
MARQHENPRSYNPLDRRWSLSPFVLLQRDINRLLEDVLLSGVGDGSNLEQTGVMMPVINVSETNNELRITAEMPGVREEDVDVTLNDDLLTIRAAKREERREEGEDLHVVERAFGTFQRTFRIPFDVDPSQVQARFENGVLTVTIPKSQAQERSQRIALQGSGQGRKDSQGSSPASKGGARTQAS